MRCVFCGHEDTRVIDSRPQSRASRIRRRRECEKCGKRFSTTEMPGDRALSPELFSPMVVKKSGAYEPLDRRKLANSIAVSLRKSRREAVNPDAIAEEVAEEIMGRDAPVDTRAIGEMILSRLKSRDPMGYMRYASVHREMSSPDDFAALLKSLREPDNADDESKSASASPSPSESDPA